MTQISEVEHSLWFKPSGEGVWQKCNAGIYNPAKDLAQCGRFIEAIEKAQELRVENYGSMGVVHHFCVISKTKTITTL